jgi:hypothetical protein
MQLPDIQAQVIEYKYKDEIIKFRKPNARQITQLWAGKKDIKEIAEDELIIEMLARLLHNDYEGTIEEKIVFIDKIDFDSMEDFMSLLEQLGIAQFGEDKKK